VNREKILSVTIKDCEVQTFTSGGPGGQNQNRVQSGVRVIHHPSGARGECRETRDQLENKRRAFRKMAESTLFQSWIGRATGKLKTDEQIQREIAEELADPTKTVVEIRQGRSWIRESEGGN
jgi:protein subunit release factor B